MKYKDIWARIDLRLWAVLLFVWFLAIGLRWPYLSFVEINSDSLSPYLSALRFWMLGFSDPPNPESDHWMWVSKVPWLFFADSLYELFAIRFVLGAFLAPMGAFCVYKMSSSLRYTGALACGIMLAIDKGLIDSLISSFRGYMAPEWIGVATCCLVLSSRKPNTYIPLVGFFVVVAGGHHPIALGCLLGLIALYPQYRRDRIFVFSLVLLCIAFVFRIIWMVQIFQCDTGGWSCLETIAMGSSESLNGMELGFRIAHDRFWTELGFGSVLVVVGIVFAWKERFFGWMILSLLGILLLGFSISTLRPYHLRIIALPMYVFSILGWQKIGRISWFVWSICILGIWFGSADIIGVQGGIQVHDTFSKKIIQKEGPFWFSGAEESDIYPAAVGLSSVLAGCSKTKYSSFPQQKIVVFHPQTVEFVLPSELDESQLSAGHDWAVTIFPASAVSIVPKK